MCKGDKLGECPPVLQGHCISPYVRAIGWGCILLRSTGGREDSEVVQLPRLETQAASLSAGKFWCDGRWVSESSIY